MRNWLWLGATQPSCCEPECSYGAINECSCKVTFILSSFQKQLCTSKKCIQFSQNLLLSAAHVSLMKHAICIIIQRLLL